MSVPFDGISLYQRARTPARRFIARTTPEEAAEGVGSPVEAWVAATAGPEDGVFARAARRT
eukprot:CAMPEP_0183304282 /NCGR_PEP_ID=MMETSP0160_2-20130417/9420_1 /TAXON_ID=2839 ORGANISM="Odontella Sinensis, Strain Grunow 1884" /NCGR_SAMPLE_ID=MMETSP0160_2 /ASSEMBLY_ACC=CAM_ASM_000250 /LENGTH=60 /DNA_ID=CAMNT_0025467299 /DNA_START=270 /DNA_END=448 /DNA_ORIENTATION=-